MKDEKQEHLKTLILLAKNGDANAFEEVYNLYYTPLFRYIYARVKKRQEAEDLTQVVFLKIWTFIPKWDTKHSSPLSFFFKVAYNTMVDHFRKRSTKDIVSDETVNVFLENKSFQNNEKETSEIREILQQIVMSLSNEQQEIITLIYTNDLTYGEISSITGKRENTIRQIHSRAIKKLRVLYNN